MLFGLIAPFIPSFIVIEFFFIIIPFALAFAVTLILLIVSLLNKKMDSRVTIFAFSILPSFIFAQLLSGFCVHKIQRFRSNQIISELNKIKVERRVLPEQYDLTAGIVYTRLNGNEHFKIEYSRGFMVTEKYCSGNGKWTSSGWND